MRFKTKIADKIIQIIKDNNIFIGGETIDIDEECAG